MALKSYGVAIEQIRLERIALPEENVTAVFDQMRAERRQFAAKYEAEGEREASAHPLRGGPRGREASARKGDEEAARIRGESAAEVAKTYADAHKVDPRALPLHALTRVAREARHQRRTSLILRTDSEPFSLLQSTAEPR